MAHNLLIYEPGDFAPYSALLGRVWASRHSIVVVVNTTADLTRELGRIANEGGLARAEAAV